MQLGTTESRKKSNELLVNKFFNLIDEISPTCSFEIGAFSAEFSRELQSKRQAIKKYAFEANPYIYNHFLKEFLFTGIEYINKIVANKNGEIEFNIIKQINGVDITPIRGDNSILEKRFGDIVYEKVLVPSVILDDFAKENNLLNEKIVMWIDVEGSVEQVLKGCENLLDSVVLIFIEVEEGPLWKDQWLEKDVFSFLTQKEFVLVDKDNENIRQYNQIYVKK
jgi:FkbM family methyltransferase